MRRREGEEVMVAEEEEEEWCSEWIGLLLAAECEPVDIGHVISAKLGIAS